MKLSNFKGLKNKSKATVISVENVSADYWVVKLKPENGVVWQAGEHGVFTLHDKDVSGKKWRAFSVASIPEEGFMMIGTRTGKVVSSFKKNLASLKKGDIVNVRGPFGWFLLQDEDSPVVLVAGGVGITPVRALIKEMEKAKTRDTNLVYSSNDHHLFKEDIEKAAASNEKLKINLTRTADETQLALKEIVKEKGNKAFYYISGNTKMIKSIKKFLKAHNIKGNRIINDPFFGY